MDESHRGSFDLRALLDLFWTRTSLDSGFRNIRDRLADLEKTQGKLKESLSTTKEGRHLALTIRN